jgi:neutral ceramidase
MKFGISKIDITPTTNLTMDGFFDRKDPSSGTLTKLYSTAYVLESNQVKVAIVCVDILGIDITLLQKVQDLVMNKTSIIRDAIIVNASHTHAAPAASRFGDMGSFFKKANPTKDDLLYYDQLAKNIATSIIQADVALEDGNIFFTQTSIEGVSSNRVHKNEAFNQIASIFQFKNLSNKEIGVLTLFANHPTILGPNNLYYSNDFISYYNQVIESTYDGAISGYLQGCAGEISSRFIKTASSVAETKRIGELLATQVIQAISHASQKVSDNLLVTTLPIHFDIREFQSQSYYQNQILAEEKTYKKLKETTSEKKTLRSGYVTLEGKRMIALMQKEIDIESIDSTMSLLQLGDIHLITTPGETFGKIEQDIQTLSNEKILVVGYTNGYVGYLPDEKSYSNHDVYEANMAPTSPTSHKMIVEIARKLLKNSIIQ